VGEMEAGKPCPMVQWCNGAMASYLPTNNPLSFPADILLCKKKLWLTELCSRASTTRQVGGLGGWTLCPGYQSGGGEIPVAGHTLWTGTANATEHSLSSRTPQEQHRMAKSPNFAICHSINPQGPWLCKSICSITRTDEHVFIDHTQRGRVLLPEMGSWASALLAKSHSLEIQCGSQNGGSVPQTPSP
jgi:hypothetical protein